MLIALTGLHGAGKTYFASNVPIKFGFKVYNKKEIIQYICKEKTGRSDWRQWYKEQFNKDAYKITEMILSYIDLNNNNILDSVHSDLEWQIISSIVPNSEIVGIVTPEFIREQRREVEDEEKDKQRIKYWHNGGGCLMTYLSWTFNGGASLELNERLFAEFLDYLHKKQLSIKGNCVQFSDNKDERIRELIRENQLLEEKLKKAKQMLNEYDNKCNKNKTLEEDKLEK